MVPLPGVIVHHVPARTRVYAGSPSLAIPPNGAYIASYDHFGPGCRRDETFVSISTDRGESWAELARLTGQWWSSLFLHGAALYLLGTTTEYGDCVIRKSVDGGATCTVPSTPDTGLLAEGRYHCSAVPTMSAGGKIWCGMEDAQGSGNWPEMIRAFIMSAPEDSDLLNARSWTFTPPMQPARGWLEGDFGGWLEGNAVLTPGGEIVDILRVESHSRETEKAEILHISSDGRSQSFDPASDIVTFPGGSKKFVIRHDPTSRHYVALVTDVPAPRADGMGIRARNTPSLVSSADLIQWTRHAAILRHSEESHHGYQAVYWEFVDADIIFLSRTSHEVDGETAHNYHDSNLITFHRRPSWRSLLSTDSGRGFGPEPS